MNGMAGAIVAPPVTCPHCGAPLKRTTVTVAGRVMHPTCWASCGCEESRRVWDKPKTKRDSRLDRAGVPSLFRGKRHPEAPRMADLMEAGEWVWVQGTYGTKKSELASCCVEELTRRGCRALFASCPDLVKSRIDDVDAWNRARSVDFLIIDDIGKENPSGYSVAAVWELVDARYAAAKPTMLTSNYSRAQLAALYAQHGEPKTAEAIASRLQLCRCVTTRGEDARGGGAR